MKPATIFSLIKRTFQEWSEDKASRLAAALAYYGVFSIPPLLLLLLVVLGRVFGSQFTEEQLQERILNQFSGLIGSSGAEALASVIENASRPDEGLVATVVGVVTLAFGASGLFSQLQDAMDTIWEVAPDPDLGLLDKIKTRLFSFTMVAVILFLLLISLVVSAGLSALNEALTGLMPETGVLLLIVNFLISLVVIILLFALVYKYIPSVKIAWRDVWIGAIITGILFTIGKEAISLYIGQSSTASSYGAAGSLVILLLWVYYAAQIFFLGAEFTQVYANQHGSRLVPEEGAVPITEEARAQQGMPREQATRAAQQEQGERGAAVTAEPGAAWQPSGSTDHRQPADEQEHPFVYYTVAVLALFIGFLRWLRGK